LFDIDTIQQLLFLLILELDNYYSSYPYTP